MAELDFQPVVRNRRGSSIKYPEQQQSLAAMSFKVSAITAALDISAGDLNSAILLLLGEIDPTDSTAVASNLGSKPDITTKVHNKIMATYKVQKCKEKNSHDIGKCIYWHTKADRRRNPFAAIKYGCMECSPDQQEAVPCPDGDTCLRAHNKHEKMFHPDIFKMTMCQRGENNGAKCSRGVFCAFAHSYDDSRKTLTSYRNIERSPPPPSIASFMPSNIHKYATNRPYNSAISGSIPATVCKTITSPEILLVVSPSMVVTPTVVEPEEAVVILETDAATASDKPLLSGQSARRRGPSEPASNRSLEVAHSTSPCHTSASDNSLNDIIENNLALSPSQSFSSYRSSPSSSGTSLSTAHSPSMEPVHCQMMSELLPESVVATAAAAAAVSASQQRITRRRGPSGPVDNLFLGLLSSSSSTPLPMSKLNDLTHIDMSSSDPTAVPEIFRAMQDQISSLRVDLMARSGALEDRNIELLAVSSRLRESQDLTSSMCVANDAMAVEIHRLRADLAATRLLLCQRDENLNMIKSMLKERDRERSTSPLDLLMGPPANGSGFPDLQNMGAMLSSVESDYESRLIKMTFKI